MSKLEELVVVNDSIEKLNSVLDWELKDGMYRVKDYEEKKKSFDKVISKIPSNIVIENDDDHKIAKNLRTSVRKVKEQIGVNRIKITSFLIGVYEEQLKSFEKSLEEKDNELKNVIYSYKPRKTNTISSETIFLKSADEKVLKKIVRQIKALCKENNITCDIGS